METTVSVTMPSIWIVLFSLLAGQLLYRQLKDCSVNDKSRGQGTFRPNAARSGLVEFLARRRPEWRRAVARDLPGAICLARIARRRHSASYTS
jgi:hypothetical protein